jgi:pimeloyl-ACP methyl ester carboxylesterase
MHPRELLVTHYMVPYLVSAGFACWVQGPRTVGNDLRLEHELAVQDVAAGMVQLRALGFKKVIFLGNSGGAGLFAYYNQQASMSPERRNARTPAGRPSGLDKATLPEGDGFVFLAPHPGQGKLLLNLIDPSVTNEEDPFSTDPSLNPFSAENGFRSAPELTSYASAFIERYKKAQYARVERIDTKARELVAERLAARKRAKEGNADSKMRAAYSGVFQIWRTDADLRCFDLTLDPSDRRWGTVWGADPIASNLGSVGFARICTPESWLSTWSGISSLASFEKCGSAIEGPVLMIEYTGDNTVFPTDCEKIFSHIGTSQKQRHRVRGNHHGQPLAPGERSGQEFAAALLVDWMKEHFGA